MKCPVLSLVFVIGLAAPALAQMPPAAHPDTSEPGWVDLFKPDLSDAIKPERVWTVEDGVITASEDQVIWSAKAYDNYILDLEFLTAPGTNSGVFLHASDIEDFVPNSVEVQIADDYHEQWANAPPSWQAGAIFGHKPATKRAVVHEPGTWNRYTITVQGDMIYVLLNGEPVNEMDMRLWTSAETNPDGSEIPEWLSRPVAELPTQGHVGFQGKHAGAPIYFRNIRIKELE